MIRLTSARQARELAGQIPALVIRRMEQFEGSDGQYDPERHGHIVVIGEQDDISMLHEISDTGLLDILDPENPGYEFLETFEEDGKTVWELAVALDNERTVAVFFTESPGLDERLTEYLDHLTNTQPRRKPMTEKQSFADAVEQNKDYGDAYDEESLWKKLSIMPRSVIEQGLEKILLLREIMLSGEAPLWARSACLVGLGYVLVPTDLVADFLPGIGYLDDLAMIGVILQSTEFFATDQMRAAVNKRLGRPEPLAAKFREGEEDKTIQQPE